MNLNLNQHSDISNRYRNIVAALENLLTQLGCNACTDVFCQSLRVTKDVYQHEMKWHRAASGLQVMDELFSNGSEHR